MSLIELLYKLLDLFFAKWLLEEDSYPCSFCYLLERGLRVCGDAGHVGHLPPCIFTQLGNLDGCLRAIQSWHAEVYQEHFVDRLSRVDELRKVLESFHTTSHGLSLDALIFEQFL